MKMKKIAAVLLAGAMVLQWQDVPGRKKNRLKLQQNR